MNAGRSSRQRGFGMIEVLVTLVILLFGLLGLAGLMIQSQQAELESYQRAQALVLMQDMVARINANRSVAPCYALTAIATGTPFAGAGSGTLPNCSAGTIPAYTRANADLAAWDNLLKGTSETSAGNSVGAMIGARGCVSLTAGGAYLVSVAWQGLNETSAPVTGLNCALNQYGTETRRRVVSVTFLIPNLN